MRSLSVETQEKSIQAGEQTGKTLKRPMWLFTSLALIIIFLSANYKLLTGAHCVVWDADGLFAPAYTLIADHAQVGRILLWNPWRSAGSPDYAEPQMGATSPLMVFMGAMTGGTEAGFRLYYLLIWGLGGLGMLMLARHLGAPPWGALVVAIGFVFSGFYTGHGQHTTPLYSFSLVPFMLWRMEVALSSRRFWPAIEAGAIWGLSSLGGYPQNTIITGGLLFLWAIGQVLCIPDLESNAGSPRPTDEQMRPRLYFAGTSLFLLFAVGTIILAAPYMAFFEEGAGYSDRVGPRPREEAVSSMPTPVGAWSSFSSPYLTDVDIWGSPRLWPTTDGTFTNVYMGVCTPILALLALVVRPRSAWRWWLFGMAVFWFCCSVGDQLPIRGLLYDYVPPTRHFRNPGWFREYAMLCVAVLATLGITDLHDAIRTAGSKTWRKFAVAATLVSGAAIVSYVHFVKKVQVQTANFSRANWFLAILWGTIFAISLMTLFPRMRRLLPTLMVLVGIADVGLTFQISRGTVSSSGPGLAIWRRIDSTHNPSLILKDLTRESSYTPFHDTYWHNKNIPMKVATFINDDTMRNRFQMDFWGRPVLLGMGTGANRIWFSSNVAVASPSTAAYAAFVKRTETLKAPVLVVHAPERMSDIRSTESSREDASISKISELPAAQRTAVKLLRYTPNHLDIIVDCPTAGWLLVTDRWAHGWKATVNGAPTQLFGGDFIFRAVRVQPGLNTVKFSYRPFGFPALLILSWGTLAAVFAASCFPKDRNSWLTF